MQVSPQVAFRGVEPSQELEAEVRDRIAELEGFCDRITGCRVVVEKPNHRHRKGDPYRVRIQVAVPRRELVVDREPSDDRTAEDLGVALRDAFDAMRRQLEDYAREVRGDVKRHEEPARAAVKKFFPEAGYGFLETPDGREIFFHAHSVVGGPDGVAHGTRVFFVEEDGEKGPQASTVRICGRHHRAD